MPSLILVIALVSLLLLGCSGVKERQERAADFVESSVENVKAQINAAKQAQEHLKAKLSEVQEGVGKVSDGFSKLEEGVEQVKGAVQ